MTANKVPPHFQQPPGYAGRQADGRGDEGRGLARAGDHANFGRGMNVATAMERGILFCGTPDQVYSQVKKFYRAVGGFGHLLIMGQAGFLDHDETVQGIRTFAREVYPRLKQEFPSTAVSGVFEPA